MSKKEIFTYAVLFSFSLLFLAGLAGCINGDESMEVLGSSELSDTPRHENYPSVQYNPNEGEFLVLWSASGLLRDDCDPGDEYECTNSFHTINGVRVSTDGELLGNTFYLSTPDTGFKVQPKSALNVSTNEYMISFGWGPEVGDKETYVVRMDSDGNIQYGPESLYPSIYNTTHPVISFSPVKQQYLVVVNDRYIFSESSLDNIGYVLDKDGNVISGPLLIGSTEGDQFNPQVAYNSVDDTFLVVWEDFRHATSFLGNCEQYGALLDSDGNMLVEIPILDDYGTEDEGKQQNQFVTHNPDNNEFLVAFGARLQPSLEDGGVVGRIVNGDGTLKGDPFVIVDGAKPQNSPQFVYVKDKKQYFMVWVEYKNDTALQPGDPFYYANNTDIFGKWLDPSGEAAGPDIPICTDSDIQSWPTLAYDPVTKRFLIVWLDQNAPDDYEPLGGGGMMAMEVKADIKCAIYGVP